MKWALVSDIINKEYSHCSPVVCRCDCSEALLPSSIPYLQFYPLTVQLNCPNFEVDTDGGNERWSKGIFTESEETAWFSNSRITDQQQFDLLHRQRHLVNQPVWAEIKTYQKIIISCACHNAVDPNPKGSKRCRRKVTVQFFMRINRCLWGLAASLLALSFLCSLVSSVLLPAG